MMLKQIMDQAKNSPWFIQPQEVQKYHKIFEHFDQAGQGKLDDTHMHAVFKQTQLPKEALDRVWTLINPKNLN